MLFPDGIISIPEVIDEIRYGFTFKYWKGKEWNLDIWGTLDPKIRNYQIETVLRSNRFPGEK